MPATPDRELRRSFIKTLLLPALTFLLIPLLGLGFIRYGESRIDGDILRSIGGSIDRDARMSGAQRLEAKAFLAEHPPSAACADPDPRLDTYRTSVCGSWGVVWQFKQSERLALFAALLGVAALLGSGLLGLIAFRNRRAQYWCFMLGWRGLVAVTALETVAQGVLLVWLSYWFTGLIFKVYFVKLIGVAALLAGAAVLAIVMALFRKAPGMEPLEGERITEAQAPGLWTRVKHLSGRLGTAPPDAIVAGIDDNFFVTEQAMTLSDGTSAGRLLYVSLPLLRTLSPTEADAVFGHELAHFHGGDTAAAARLYPMLVRYQAYALNLAAGGLTKAAANVMWLFRAIFELALRRDQRQRELVADAEAARLTSPDDLGRALLKILGYSSFRARTELELFQKRAVHQGGLSLRGRIDEGLAAYAASPGFQEHVRTHQVPHPFDSHPPLEERLAGVATSVNVEDTVGLLQARPSTTWADDVLDAAEIEGRLWGAYEARFQAQHEISLAWRYLPSTDEERALVMRHFPDKVFPQKDGGELKLTCLELIPPGGAPITLAEIDEAKVDNGTLSDDLVLHRRDAAGKDQTFKVKLRPLGAHVENFKKAFGAYWQRARAASKQVLAEQVRPGPGEPGTTA